MEKVLSISIAAYNAEHDIGRCLDSMVKTNVADKLDIIIVNDGSKDRTLEIAKSYEEQYQNIVRVIDKKNGGHGSTINASIKVALGKYYKIVDSDDWVDSEGLERLVNDLEISDADLILNPYHDIDASTLKRNSLINPYVEGAIINVKRSIDEIEDVVIYMHSTTFKTAVVQSMGSVIDEHCFYVDMEYTLLPLLFVESYICFSYPVYQYLMGTSTQSMNKQNLIKRRDQHLRVTKRIISFYESKKDDVGAGTREMILRRVKLALLNQYKIYFNMESKASKEEIIEFDAWVKENSKEVYQGPEGRLMKIIKLNRKTGFAFYGITNNALKRLHMEPTL